MNQVLLDVKVVETTNLLVTFTEEVMRYEIVCLTHLIDECYQEWNRNETLRMITYSMGTKFT